MKTPIKLILLFLLLFNCSEDNDDNMEAPDNTCIELTQNTEWVVEQFKNDFTIQFPDNYDGGITGFEGNLFLKFRDDNMIRMGYNYCGPLFCEDFGDETVSEPFPESITTLIFGEVTLTNTQQFCVNGEVVAILYYSDPSDARGKLFMKQEGEFVEALSVVYSSDTFDEVIAILTTIRETL